MIAQTVQMFINGLSLGSLYAVIALGVALVFSVMRLTNFAHAGLLMLAAFAMFLTSALPAALWAVAAILAATLGAVLMERVAFRPLRGADGTTLMVASFGVLIILQYSAQSIAGSRPLPVKLPAFLLDSVSIGSLSLQYLTIITIAFSGVALLGLGLILKRTRTGLQMRAAAEDLLMARMLGVNANRVVTTAFILSGVLAGIGAVLLAARTGTVSPNFGFQVVIVAFIACVVGGMGSLSGAVIGGLSIGFVVTFLQAVLPNSLVGYRDVFMYIAVISVLLIRPQGIKGTVGRLA